MRSSSKWQMNLSDLAQEAIKIRQVVTGKLTLLKVFWPPPNVPIKIPILEQGDWPCKLQRKTNLTGLRSELTLRYLAPKKARVGDCLGERSRRLGERELPTVWFITAELVLVLESDSPISNLMLILYRSFNFATFFPQSGLFILPFLFFFLIPYVFLFSDAFDFFLLLEFFPFQLCEFPVLQE